MSRGPRRVPLLNSDDAEGWRINSASRQRGTNERTRRNELRVSANFGALLQTRDYKLRAWRMSAGTKVDSEIILSRGVICAREAVEQESTSGTNCTGRLKMTGRHLLCKQSRIIFHNISRYRSDARMTFERWIKQRLFKKTRYLWILPQKPQYGRIYTIIFK